MWNTQLEDGGALALGSLAAAGAGGAPCLATLNLGKNLISGVAKRLIEGATREGVRVQAY